MWWRGGRASRFGERIATMREMWKENARNVTPIILSFVRKIMTQLEQAKFDSAQNSSSFNHVPGNYAYPCAWLDENSTRVTWHRGLFLWNGWKQIIMLLRWCVHTSSMKSTRSWLREFSMLAVSLLTHQLDGWVVSTYTENKLLLIGFRKIWKALCTAR